MPHVFIKISSRAFQVLGSGKNIDNDTAPSPTIKKVLSEALTVGAYAIAIKLLNGNCFACVNATQEKEVQQDFTHLDNLLTGTRPATGELLATFLRSHQRSQYFADWRRTDS